MNGKNLGSKGFMSAVWATLECWCWCWKWISYQGFLLITHTILRRKARKRFKSCFSFNWELRKHENVWFYISCPTTSLTGSPGQKKKCGMNVGFVGLLGLWQCQIKSLGLLGLPCTAGLCWVLYQIISKFSSYSAFQYCRCRERQVCRTGLGWGLISFCGSWFRNLDKIPFLVRLQLTVSTNHKICLLPISLKFISV